MFGHYQQLIKINPRVIDVFIYTFHLERCLQFVYVLLLAEQLKWNEPKESIITSYIKTENKSVDTSEERYDEEVSQESLTLKFKFVQLKRSRSVLHSQTS